MSNNKGTSSAPAAVSVNFEDDIADNLKWNIVKDGDNYTIHPNGNTKMWLYCTNANNGVRVGTNANKVFTMDTTGYLKNTATSRYLGVYNKQDWRCYSSTTVNIGGQSFKFYVQKTGSISIVYTTVMVCNHTSTTSTTTAATCVQAGSTIVTCDDCGTTVSTTEIPATGNHDYGTGNNCIICGAEKPDVTEKTVTMNIYANKGSLSNNVITWTSGDVTFQNAKNSSQTAIRTSDSDHYRMYKGSSATATANGAITKLVFTCNSSSYATALKNSISGDGVSVSVSGSDVTVTFTNPTNSFTIKAMSAAVWFKTLKVTYSS